MNQIVDLKSHFNYLLIYFQSVPIDLLIMNMPFLANIKKTVVSFEDTLYAEQQMFSVQNAFTFFYDDLDYKQKRKVLKYEYLSDKRA